MPQERMPNWVTPIDLDAPWTPLKMAGESISDDFALRLVQDTWDKYEPWRSQNCDQRWRLNEWLYYGYVPPRVWDGTTIQRSSLPVQIAYDQVEAAHAKLASALLTSDEIIGVSPEGDTNPDESAQVRDRLIYLMDHNIDDYGWNARLELKLTLRDQLIYGNNFGMIEYDHVRKQSTIIRLDPRDVYVDPACPSPYIEQSRGTLVRKLMTVDEVDSMRAIEGVKVPPRDVLNWLAKNRDTVIADRAKQQQEASRGVRYQPGYDDWSPMPSSRFIEVLIYQDGNREIWTLNRLVVMINMIAPYGCTRLVSAPCSPVPNRFYAQSYVDILDPIQQAATALLNRHMDEMALALNPPRVAKSGVIRTPSSLSWRPGLVNEAADPKNDLIVHPPQNVTQDIFQTIGYFEQMAEKRTGQNSLSTSGLARPGNANRTRGGMAMQMQAPAERLGAIAANFEDFFLVPMFYKMLRVEKAHAEGDVYGRKSARSTSGTSRADARRILESITTAS